MSESATIGCEHLLMGIVMEGEGVGGLVLKRLDVDMEKLSEVLRARYADKDDEHPTGATVPFTWKSKKVLELSLREALQLGHNYIGTEHLLLGLIREGENPACEILTQDFHVTLSDVRSAVVQLLAGYAERSKMLDDEPRPAAVVAYMVAFPDRATAHECLAWLEGFEQTFGPLRSDHAVTRLRGYIESGGEIRS